MHVVVEESRWAILDAAPEAASTRVAGLLTAATLKTTLAATSKLSSPASRRADWARILEATDAAATAAWAWDSSLASPPVFAAELALDPVRSSVSEMSEASAAGTRTERSAASHVER